MASRHQPSSAHGTPQNPPPASLSPAPSAKARAYSSTVQQCVVLCDWWLKRVDGEDGKIRVFGYTRSTGNRAARVFRSNFIKRRYADGTLETVDGFTVLIRGPLNFSQMDHNGFPHEVSKWFQLGFPVEWEKRANPNMKQTNEKSTNYYIQKFLNSCHVDLSGYAFLGNDSDTSKMFTCNTEGPPIQRLSDLFNGTPRSQECTGGNDNWMGKMAASKELCYTRMDMPEEFCAAPQGTRNGGQADVQHKSVHIDASAQEIVNHSISSVLVKQSTGSICLDSQVDGKSLSAAKIASFKKGGYRNKVPHGALPAEKCGSDQAEQNSEIQLENFHRYSSEQEIATHSIDSSVVNNHIDHISSDLEECETPKHGKTLVEQGTEGALELPTKVSPRCGVARGSEDNTVRRLRNGKVFGMSNGASLKRKYHKRKTTQHETFNRKTAPDEAITSTAYRTSHENVMCAK